MLHQFNTNTNQTRTPAASSSAVPLPLVITIVAALLLGAGAGYLVKTRAGGSIALLQGSTNARSGGAASVSYGKKNTELFPDSASGTVRKGGVGDEGTHHLERRGGPSQNVYLTSSAVDLTKLVGKTVTVWGKTYEAQTAGWLMDVGYVEVQ